MGTMDQLAQAGRGIARASAGSTASATGTGSNFSFFRHPFVPVLTAFAVCFTVVVGVRTLTAGPTIISTLWLASGLGAAVWMRAGRGLAFDLAFGGMLAFALMAGEMLLGNPPHRAVIFMGLSLLETTLSVVLMRRFLPRGDVSTVAGQVRMVLCIFLGTLPSAILCAFLLRHGALDGPIAGMRMWWLGHGLGTVMVCAAGLSLSSEVLTRFRKPRFLAEFAIIQALVIAGSFFIFMSGSTPIAFFMLPLMLLSAVRLGVVGIAISLVVLSVVAIKSSVLGTGPYFAMDLDDRLAVVQMLILFGYAPMLIVAALLQERDALAQRAREGHRRAEQASLAKSRLLANVAHEIKSPVSGIIGISEMWASGALGEVDSNQIEMAQMMVRTGRQIETLAHDLLDVAKAESGAVRIELRPTDVHGALQDAAQALRLMPEAAGLAIEVIEEDDGLMVMADSQRLAQILGNLGSNAAKYGNQGGYVRLRAARVGNRLVRLSVEDGGPGLTAEKQTQLFEPFNRLGLERSAIEGHGIGLALSKRLAELQNGEMGVNSEPGQGAAFWIDLPEAA